MSHLIIQVPHCDRSPENIGIELKHKLERYFSFKRFVILPVINLNPNIVVGEINSKTHLTFRLARLKFL